MNKIIFLIIVTSLYLPSLGFSQCGIYGVPSDVTSSGTEFLLCFPDSAFNSFGDGREGELIYLLGGEDTTEVTITCKAFPLYKKQLTILPNSSVLYDIKKDIDPQMPRDQSDAVQDKAVHVIADKPITCFYRIHELGDGALALPKSRNGNLYRVITSQNYYHSFPGTVFPTSSFIVAAFDDDTKITITLTAPSWNGTPANIPTDFTINRGECIQFIASDQSKDFDLTGSLVKSNKQTTVYASGLSTIPNDFAPTAIGDGGSLFETIPPVSTLGKRFLCRRFPPRVPTDTINNTWLGLPMFDIVRVLAHYDNTEVRINGNLWSTLQAGEKKDTNIFNSVLIECSQPTIVSQFSHSAYFAREDGDTLGSEFMTIIPPIEQVYNDYRFVIDELDSIYLNHYVLVAGYQSIRGKVQIDGVAIPDTGYIDFTSNQTNRTYTIGAFKLTKGYHRITSPGLSDSGFTIIPFGAGFLQAYGYGAGSLYKPLRGIQLDGSNSLSGIAQKDNTITIHNILSEKVYLDSVKITPSNVRLRERIWQDVNHLEGGQEVVLHLDGDKYLEEPVIGDITIYHHTTKWRSLEPQTLKFTYKPQTELHVQGIVRDSEIPEIRYSEINQPMIYFPENWQNQDVVINCIDLTGKICNKQKSFIPANRQVRLHTEKMARGFYFLSITNNEKSSRLKLLVL